MTLFEIFLHFVFSVTCSCSHPWQTINSSVSPWDLHEVAEFLLSLGVRWDGSPGCLLAVYLTQSSLLKRLCCSVSYNIFLHSELTSMASCRRFEVKTFITDRNYSWSYSNKSILLLCWLNSSQRRLCWMWSRMLVFVVVFVCVRMCTLCVECCQAGGIFLRNVFKNKIWKGEDLGTK